MDSEDNTNLHIGICCAFIIIGMIGGSILTEKSIRKAAIQNGAAYYNPKDGEFTWFTNSSTFTISAEIEPVDEE